MQLSVAKRNGRLGRNVKSWKQDSVFFGGGGSGKGNALWSSTTKNPNKSAGPLTRRFISSLAPLTHLLALPCSLCSHAPLRSLVCSLAHFTHSLARGKVNDWMAVYSVFSSILAHCVLVTMNLLSIALWFKTA